MSNWLAEGRLTSVEDTASGGIETFRSTLLRLFNGQNTGKLVLELQRCGDPARQAVVVLHGFPGMPRRACRVSTVESELIFLYLDH